MRLLLILLLLFPAICSGNEYLKVDCEDLAEVEQSVFQMFDLKDFVELGQCVGVKLLKQGKDQSLAKACSEVIEDQKNLLGSFSLSKAEAIQIGQCVGIIKYIYDHYNGDIYSRSSYQKYRCKKGEAAVEILIATSGLISLEQVREKLCIP